MTQRRLLALLSLMMALIAGVLMILGIAHLFNDISLRWFLDRLIAVVLGVVAIIGGLMTYNRRYVPGGVTNAVAGIIAIIVAGEVALGVLILMAGVLSLVAESA